MGATFLKNEKKNFLWLKEGPAPQTRGKVVVQNRSLGEGVSGLPAPGKKYIVGPRSHFMGF